MMRWINTLFLNRTITQREREIESTKKRLVRARDAVEDMRAVMQSNAPLMTPKMISQAHQFINSTNALHRKQAQELEEAIGHLQELRHRVRQIRSIS